MPKLRTANLLGALAGEVSDRLDRRLRSHPNQTDSSAAALNVIAYDEGCSNNALARALRLSHTATVRLVDKLEATGLVEARPGRDKRAVALFLTDEGRSQARAVVVDRCLALGELLDVLSPDEHRQLALLTDKLLRGLTTSAQAADHICRLCDGTVCPQDRCPVHLATLEYRA